MGSFGRSVLTAVLASVGAAVLAYGSRVLGGSVDGMAPLWLANVAVLAPLLRFRGIDRGSALIGTGGGLTVANVLTGSTLFLGTALAAVNVGEIAVGLLLFERLADRGVALYTPRNLAAFLVSAGILAPVLAAAVGSGLLAAEEGAAFLPVALHWFAADALGMIVVGPLILVGGCADCMGLLRSPRRIEIVGALLGVGATTFIVFQQSRYPALFLILPAITLAVFRLRFIGAATGIVAVAIIASIETLRGAGPIASALSDTGERILFLQAFLAVVVVAKFPVAAILVEREAVARRLTDAEQRFRRMAEDAPIAMFRANSAGFVVYGNPRWERLVGARIGEKWHTIVVPEGRAAAEYAWMRADGAEAFSGEFEFIRRDGEPGWVSLAMSAEANGAGAANSWIGIVTDIEERRRADLRLAASERQYRLLADNSNDMIVRLGLDGVRRYVSPACRAILGYDPAEMVGATPIAAIHAEDRARVERICRSLLDGAVDPTCTYRQRRKDGTYAWLEATYRLVRDHDGASIEFVASVRDIGKRRSAEIATAAANARFEERDRLLGMAESMAGVGHWRLDAVTHDVFWSDEVFRIHGRPIGDLPPLAEAIEAYHPEDRAHVGRLVEEALLQGSPWTLRARIIRPDGVERHVESSGQAERAPDGTIVGIVGVFRDVTDEVDAAAALTRARDEARASAEAKSAFLATMSHEIRTPMTGVLGMIELLRSDLPPEDRRRFFDNLEQSATLLMTVLDDILDFSKIESRNLVIEHVDFDLGELARNTMDLFHHAASKKGLIFSMAAPIGRDMRVKGDPVRLQQVMSNLISNAIKFTNRGKIELRIELEPYGRRREVRIDVVDTGVGIEADVVDKLFEPFIQADASTTRRFGGTGLGLAISRRLVEAMGGAINVESVVGSGTRFHVELELEAGRTITVTPRSMPTGVASELSVLLAEDNQINRALVEALVRKAGHRIRSVENGRLAVEAAAQDGFDVILMDMQMPEMDGLAATRAIRDGDGPCARVPIIALTADASPERRRFYDNAGLTEFLTKPVDSRLLQERLTMIALGSSEALRTIDPVEPSGGLLDEEKLAGFEEAIGHGATHQLVEMLAADLRTRPPMMMRMIELDQREAIMAEAHALKGATLNIGAIRVGFLASRLEDACAKGLPLDDLGRELAAAARATRIAIDERAKRRARA